MSTRITNSIAITLVVLLVLGPCMALASPSSERKDVVSPPLKTIKSSRPKIARPFAARPQTSALRPGQTVTLLPDGRSLLIGGEENGEPLATASVTDIQTGVAVSLPAKLNRARAWHSATLLADGRVLILGGVGNGGGLVRTGEIFNPATQSFSLLPASEGMARAHHTATLLITGDVLITGGSIGQGVSSNKALLWNFKTGQFTALANRLSVARQKHRALLLHNGNVLIESGIADDGSRISGTELYNADAGTFSFSSLSATDADLRDPYLTMSLPTNGATDVPVNTFAGLLFSKQLRVETINVDTLTLTGPEGVVQTKVVPAENGKLAFLTPADPLLPGITYTIAASGIADANGQTIPPASISFTTKGERENEDTGTHGVDWIPDETNLHGSWRSKFKDSQWRSLLPLQAPAGETAVAGQTLTLDGKPLTNVTLRIGSRTALTDSTGRFLITGIDSGHQVLTIDGRTASSNRKQYGIFRVGVKVKAGVTTALEYTIWMPKLDLTLAKNIASPTADRTVITNPRIPGLEVVLPAGTLIRDLEGNNVTEISITPIPTNQPPFPLPPGVDVPVYFTIQPGGSQIIPPRAQLIYPNFIGSKPGTRIDFWNYDPTGKGWYVYGHGTVTPNGKQIVPDPGVVLYEFSGAMIGLPSLGPLFGPQDGSNDGDPVDLGTGLLVVDKTDLAVTDTIPVSLTRTYRQNDTRSRPFGIGATHPYEIFLVGDTFPYTFQEVVLPNGGRVRYDRVSPGTGFSDAIYENLTVPGPFYKSRINWNGSGWDLRTKDGSLYVFPDGFGASQPNQCALLRMEDRNGNVLTLTRDANKNLTRIGTPHGRWIELTYDTSNRITQATDNIGRTVIYTYDASGRLWKVTDPNNGITEYTYDSSHRMLTIKDARGVVYLTNEYDASGRVSKQTLADDTPANSTDNPTYLFNYTTDSGGRIVQTDITDPRGDIRRVTFGTNGYSVTDTSALGTADEQGASFEREAGTNFLLAVVDALNRRTEYAYDSMGNMTSVTSLAGTGSAATTTMTYESVFNQLDSVTDPLNHITTYNYDASGNLTKITDALDHETTIGYDEEGQITSITDPLQHTTQFVYDLGNLMEVTDPLNRTVSLFTDAAGRLIKITDPLGNWTRYEYNPLNQIKKITELLGGVTEIGYDANGNTLSIKDARNQTTSFTYDSMDRVVSRTDALQGATSTETFEYDLEGNATKLIDRRGKVTTLQYDNLDRPVFAGFGTTAGPTYESTVAYTYDLYDRITQVVDSISGTINITFDDLARTASEASPQGTVSFTYDKLGRLTAKSVTGQAGISYNYDNANRLLSMTQGLTSVGFTHDDANRRSSLTLPNGIVVDYTYDAGSQLTGLAYRNGATVLGNLTYAYDKSGRVTTTGGTLARTGLPQTLSSATYNAANRLTQKGATTLSYDASGNLTNDGVNTYTWDARNQLVGISGAVSASFQYDGLGRRVRRTINGAATDYLYDGTNVDQEQVGGTPTANLLTGNTDEIFSRTEGTNLQSVLADGLGSTMSLLDSAGAAQTEYTYEPFGNTSTVGAASGNSSQYTGRENDGTSLYYYRARYYSPTLQRFISEDPMDFAAGETNLYSYVANSPCNYTDPSGHFLVAGCVAGALTSGAMDLLSGRKLSLGSLAEGCLMGMLFGLAGRALGAGLRALGPRLPRILRLPRAPNPGRGPCFIAGTLVQTVDGEKPIEEIRVGDRVLSSDPERPDAAKHKPEGQRVTRTFERTTSIVLDISFGDIKITTTPEHPFWVVDEGWVRADSLHPGSQLLTTNGSAVCVETIKRREGEFKVYNFEVDEYHTYYVSSAGVLVHNTCDPYRPPRPLPRDPVSGRPVPESPYPHTQLGEKVSTRTGQPYTQAREFGQNGQHVKDIHFTDHGMKSHPNPHQHIIDPVTGKRGGPVPFP